MQSQSHMNKSRPFTRCRLCGDDNYLLKSHLLPASIYRILRSDVSGQEDTIVVTNDIALPTSRQMENYLLCKTCEDRINKNGERWMMKYCYRGGSEFLFRDILNSAKPLLQGDKLRIYDAKNISSIDVGQIVYFAASVFWRAAVSFWPIGKKRLKPIDLGPECEERLRQFLLSSGPFPNDATLAVFVSPQPQPLLVAYPPFGGRKDTWHDYRFVIPGVYFLLSVGKRISDFAKNICIVRSSEQFIIMAESIDQKVFDDTFALYKRQYDRRILRD